MESLASQASRPALQVQSQVHKRAQTRTRTECAVVVAVFVIIIITIVMWLRVSVLWNTLSHKRLLFHKSILSFL